MTPARWLVALLAVALVAVAVLRRQPVPTAELEPTFTGIDLANGRDWSVWIGRNKDGTYAWRDEPEDGLGPCGTCAAPKGLPHQRGCFWDTDPMRPFPPYVEPEDGIEPDPYLSALADQGRGA